MTTSTQLPPLPKTGDILLSRYVIEAVIGEGGFATVYRGNQLGVERTVAIKCLDPSAVEKDAGAPQRFAREARLASSLEHPNTITIFDYGRTESGILFLVMEYVQGMGLDEVLNTGPVSPERAARLIRQVLHSLREAHDHKIIHRDLKPSNIMVCDRAGESDVVKVLDFGVAKALTGDAPMDITRELTGVDRIIGTPRYMSPEQIRGKNLAPSSDLYSVGLVFYEMLAGRPMVQQEESMAVLGAQLSPQAFQIPADAQIPPAFRRVIEQALTKDPAQRFQSVNEFLGALDYAPVHISQEQVRLQLPEAETLPMDLGDIKALVAEHQARKATQGKPGQVVIPHTGSTARPRQAKTGSLVLLNIMLAIVLLLLGIIFGAVVLPRMGKDGPNERVVYVTEAAPDDENAASGAPPVSPSSSGMESFHVRHAEGLVLAATAHAMTSAVPVVFTFDGEPQDAGLYLGDALLGTGEGTLTFLRSELPNEIELRAEGYFTDWVWLTADGASGPVTYALRAHPRAEPAVAASPRRERSSTQSDRRARRAERSERAREEPSGRSSRSEPASEDTEVSAVQIAPIDEPSGRRRRPRSRRTRRTDESRPSALVPIDEAAGNTGLEPF